MGEVSTTYRWSEDKKGNQLYQKKFPLKDRIAKEVKKNKRIYVFVVPALVFFFVFRYIPLYFIQIAFKDYRITRDLADCAWVGFKYFEMLFQRPLFIQVLKNTLIISLAKLIFVWPLPIIVAIFLNEQRNQTFKKVTQTIIYLPHFISWVVIGGIIINFLSLEGGLLNKILEPFLDKPVFFLGEKSLFRPILVVSQAWKEMGWQSIIYLATITRINPELYEAAIVDGASRMRRIWHITLPGILDVMVVLFILRIGHLLNAGFEQNLVLVNAFVREIGEILDTYVYRIGLGEGNYSLATAAGIFKSVIAAILLNVTDRIAKRAGQSGLF